MDVTVNKKKEIGRVKWILASAAALIIVCIVAVAAVRIAAAQQHQPAQLPSPQDLSRAFIDVAKQVKPAVVNIDVVEKPKKATRGFELIPQIPGFPPFGDAQPRQRQRGTGSGVIVSADGYILTNNHVAGDADEIKVTLADGREFKAKRVGTDTETDLALIKIDIGGLPYARLGNSDALEQGEWVIALGSPFGLQQTMTAGIVSAVGRDLRVGTYDNFIQTDASINPGNSGGPLVNMKGEVVGINTLIFSRTGVSEGVGFSIPSNLAGKVYDQLAKNGKVTRGYLGVTLQPITPALARTVGFSGTDGALVTDLAKGDAPAAKAGLRSGDVIVEFNGKPVKSPRELTDLVADTPVGTAARVKYVRDGQTNTAVVNLGERPLLSATESDDGDDGEGGSSAKLGISRFQSVTPQLARELKLKVNGGAVITNVQQGSPAAEAGVRPGDVVHRIDRIEISNAQELSDALKSLGAEKEVVLQIERNGQLTFVTITLD
jgi:serine protease Do